MNEVLEGGTPLSSSVATRVFKLFQFLAQSGPAPVAETQADYRLTQREKEVLRLLVMGQSYKMIADSATISYGTVHSHIKNIYKKLHVASMTEAVAKALLEKLV